ncbi:unnamed protein product [Auanema sp. JU1783]|nr:unnamed protein product [Auanema sp. JU1783]
MSLDADSQDDNIEITIRCALQTNPDETMTVPLSWSVVQLKEHIHTVYPTHPDASSQKLIFCGSCLNNDFVLRMIFNETRRVVGGPQVLHLVCPMAASTPQLRQRRANNDSQAQNPTPPPSYENVANDFPGAYASGVNYPAAMSAYRDYYNSYITYYQQYSNAMMNMNMNGTNYPFPHPVFVNNGPGVPVTTYYPNVPNVNVQPVNPIPQPNVVNPQPAQPAAPAGRRLEEGLDFFYNFFRAVLLLTAILLYSSLERFLLVAAIISVIVFTQLRRAQNRRAAQAAALHVNNNNAGEERIQEDAPTETEANVSAEGVDSLENERQQENITTQPAPPSGLQVFLSTCFSFVTSFVASLIPENIPVEVN